MIFRQKSFNIWDDKKSMRVVISWFGPRDFTLRDRTSSRDALTGIDAGYPISLKHPHFPSLFLH